MNRDDFCDLLGRHASLEELEGEAVAFSFGFTGEGAGVGAGHQRDLSCQVPSGKRSIFSTPSFAFINKIALKIYLLLRIDTNKFNYIVSQFISIFPFVSDVFVGFVDEIAPADTPAEPDTIDIAFRERGSDLWIRSRDMSAGMRRTLIHLFEIALAPPGTVFLVDEYENSLGVNCLSALTDQLQRRGGEVQFILTSHHPYIIENIPKQHWKILTRRGGVVQARGYESFPSLQTRSRQGNFSQLLDLLDREAPGGDAPP